MKKLFLFLTIILIPLLGFSTNYYPKNGSGAGNQTHILSSWGTNTNGTGTQPTSFTNPNDVFIFNKDKTVSSTWIVSNISVNNGFILTLSTSTTVTGTITLNGNIISNGNLTLDLNTGAISNAGSGSITGDITVKKNILSKGWHYIATPLNNVTLAQFNDDSPVNSATCYYYDETIPSVDEMQGWTPYSNLTSSVNVGNGYILYFYNSGEIDFTGTYSHNTSYTITVTNTNSGNTDSDGWNLLGNPYPSTLDWEEVIADNDVGFWASLGGFGIDDAVYYWDGANKRYASYINGQGANGGTRYIPSLQAFFIHKRREWLTSPNFSDFDVDLNSGQRTTTTNPSLWKLAALSNILRINITSDDYPSDELVVRLHEDATDTFDTNYDAYKLTNSGNTPSISTQIGDVKYSINSINTEFDEIIIDINLNVVVSGDYQLEFEGLDSFDPAYNITLLDSNNLEISDLDQPYAVNITSGTYNGIYKLKLTKASSLTGTYNGNKNDIKVFSYDKELKIEMNSNQGTVSIVNMSGVEIHNSTISNTYTYTFDKSGIYIVSVYSNSGLITKKVYIE